MANAIGVRDPFTRSRGNRLVATFVALILKPAASLRKTAGTGSLQVRERLHVVARDAVALVEHESEIGTGGRESARTRLFERGGGLDGIARGTLATKVGEREALAAGHPSLGASAEIHGKRRAIL